MFMSGFTTRAIHVGSTPEATTGAVIPPIFATSTFAQSSPGVHQGLDYGRSHNPTRWALEECLASLEGGARAFVFGSGMAAAATLLETMPANSHIIAVDDLYGGTFRLFERVRKETAGLSVSYVPLDQPFRLADYVTPATRMVWVESPTNPLLKVVDLAEVVRQARELGLVTVCDNTFASPALQNPLSLGFDVVTHSMTKYINGHSDVVAGALVAREDGPLAERIGFLQNSCGAILGPFDCFLVHRGVKTLGVRMERTCASAQKIAQALAIHPRIAKVIYPGLATHPAHDVARKQMSAFGGMITVVLDADLHGTRRFLEACRVFTLAESLGGVESLIEHPAIMTHASIPAERRRASGIDDGLVRISVGIEEVEDLLDDLHQALEKV